VDGLWTTKSEGVGLIVRVISFRDFQRTWSTPDPPTSQTDGRTDRQTTCKSQYRSLQYMHRAVPVVFLLYTTAAGLLADLLQYRLQQLGLPDGNGTLRQTP